MKEFISEVDAATICEPTGLTDRTSHFVIINDCKEFDEGCVDILGVEHSLEKAKQIFQQALVTEMKRAEIRDWNIIENTDECFKAECEEEWSGNYTYLYIQEV